MWYRPLPPPPYVWNISIPELFWSQEGFHYEVFRYSETTNFRQKNVTSPFYAKNLSIPETFWNPEVFLYKKFRYCETKQFRRNIVIPAPRSYSYHFSIPEIFWNIERLP